MSSTNLIETLEKLAQAQHAEENISIKIDACLEKIKTLRSPACTANEVVCE